MKIYYYHTRPIQEALDEWKNHLHPGHILYMGSLISVNTVFTRYSTITVISHPVYGSHSTISLKSYVAKNRTTFCMVPPFTD